MRLNQLSKHICHFDWGISKTCILNASTASSGVEKHWPLILFFTYGNKKKSFGAKSGLYGRWLIKLKCWVLKNAVVWVDVWELALSCWRVIRHRRLVFWFLARLLANKWLCTTQNWHFCVVLVVQLRHIQFFRKNWRSFAWKCFVREQLLLDLAHLETFIQLTAVYFRAYTRKSRIHYLSQCHRRVSKHRDRIFGVFLSTNRHVSFFERLTNCVGTNANKFFWQSNVQMYAGPTNT